MFSAQQEKLLASPLSPTVIKKRQSFGNSGPTLVYIEGWYAIDKANQIFGYDGWSMETIRLEETSRDEGKDRKGNVQWQVSCVATVRVRVGQNGHTITREGTGFGSGFSKLIGDAIEGAYKEAETDALKRALRSFGNQFGNALYDKEFSNVEGTPANRAKQAKEQEQDVTPASPPLQASPAEGSVTDSPAESSAPSHEESEDPAPKMNKAKAREPFKEMQEEIRTSKNEDDLKNWGAANSADIATLPDDWQREIRNQYREKLAEHREAAKAAAEAPTEEENDAPF